MDRWFRTMMAALLTLGLVVGSFVPAGMSESWVISSSGLTEADAQETGSSSSGGDDLIMSSGVRIPSLKSDVTAIEEPSLLPLDSESAESFSSITGPVILSPAQDEPVSTQNVTVAWEPIAGADAYTITLMDASGQSYHFTAAGTAASYAINFQNWIVGQTYRVCVTASASSNGSMYRTQAAGWRSFLYAYAMSDAPASGKTSFSIVETTYGYDTGAYGAVFDVTAPGAQLVELLIGGRPTGHTYPVVEGRVRATYRFDDPVGVERKEVQFAPVWADGSQGIPSAVQVLYLLPSPSFVQHSLAGHSLGQDVDIAWTAVSGAQGYRLTVRQVDGPSAEVLFTKEVATNHCVVPGSTFLASGRYMAYLEVIAQTPGAVHVLYQEGASSIGTSFDVQSILATPVFTDRPSLITSARTPLFAWDEVPGATHYEVRMTQWVDGEPLWFSSIIRSNAYSVAEGALVDGRQYAFSVRAVVQEGGSTVRCSDWAQTEFTLYDAYVDDLLTFDMHASSGPYAVDFTVHAPDARAVALYVNGERTGELYQVGESGQASFTRTFEAPSAKGNQRVHTVDIQFAQVIGGVEGLPSRAQTLTVAPAPEPHAASSSPAGVAQHGYVQQDEALGISWSDGTNRAAGYRVEITSWDGQQTIHSAQVSESFLQVEASVLEALPLGSYAVHVDTISDDSPGNLTLVARGSSFFTLRGAPLEAPDLTQVAYVVTSDEELAFSWDEVDGATHYILSLLETTENGNLRAITGEDGVVQQALAFSTAAIDGFVPRDGVRYTLLVQAVTLDAQGVIIRASGESRTEFVYQAAHVQGGIEYIVRPLSNGVHFLVQGQAGAQRVRLYVNGYPVNGPLPLTLPGGRAEFTQSFPVQSLRARYEVQFASIVDDVEGEKSDIQTVLMLPEIQIEPIADVYTTAEEITIRWTGDPEVTRYVVNLYHDALPYTLSRTVEGTSMTIALDALWGAGTYRVMIEAQYRAPDAEYTLSPISSAAFALRDAPQAPLLLSAPGAIWAGGTPVFEWRATQGMDRYQVRLFRQDAPETALHEGVVTGTAWSYEEPMEEGTAYLFTVAALLGENGKTVVGEEAAVAFTYQPGYDLLRKLVAPDILEPVDGGGVPLAQTLRVTWSGDERASYYILSDEAGSFMPVACEAETYLLLMPEAWTEGEQVTLYVTAVSAEDPAYSSDPQAVTCTVEAPGMPSVRRFTADRTTALVGQEITFDAYLTNATEAVLILEGGEGNAPVMADAEGCLQISYAFDAPGTYPVRLAPNGDASCASPTMLIEIVDAAEKLPSPVITTPLGGMVIPAMDAGSAIDIAWNPVEGEGITYRLSAAVDGMQGEAISTQHAHVAYPWDPAWQPGEGVTITLEALSPYGEAYHSDPVSSVFEVVEASSPVVTAYSLSRMEPMVGETVVISVQTQNQPQTVQLYVDGIAAGEPTAVAANRAELVHTFDALGPHGISVVPDGEPSLRTGERQVYVQRSPLEAPEMSIASTGGLPLEENLAVSWTTDARASDYVLTASTGGVTDAPVEYMGEAGLPSSATIPWNAWWVVGDTIELTLTAVSHDERYTNTTASLAITVLPPRTPRVTDVSVLPVAAQVGEVASLQVKSDNAEMVLMVLDGVLFGTPAAVQDGTATVEHTFLQPGSYQVRFAPDGDLSRLSMPILYTVQQGSAPRIKRIERTPGPVAVGQAMQFAIETSGAQQVALDIDGRAVETAQLADDGIAHFTHVFDAVGTYEVAFTVLSEHSARQTETLSIEVGYAEQASVLGYSVTPALPIVGQEAQLDIKVQQAQSVRLCIDGVTQEERYPVVDGQARIPYMFMRGGTHEVMVLPDESYSPNGYAKTIAVLPAEVAEADIRFTASWASKDAGREVLYAIVADEAQYSEVLYVVNGAVEAVIPVSEGGLTLFTHSLPGSGVYEVQFAAMTDGVPQQLTEAKRIALLAAPAYLLADTAPGVGALLAQWDEVDGADRYEARVEGGEAMYTEAGALTLLQEQLPRAGDYLLQVAACSDAYDLCRGEVAWLSVTASAEEVLATPELQGVQETLRLGDRVTLSWEPVPGATQYEVDFRHANAGTVIKHRALTSGLSYAWDERSLPDGTPLQVGETYTLAVRAVDAAGTHGAWAESTFQVVDDKSAGVVIEWITQANWKPSQGEDTLYLLTSLWGDAAQADTLALMVNGVRLDTTLEQVDTAGSRTVGLTHVFGPVDEITEWNVSVAAVAMGEVVAESEAWQVVAAPAAVIEPLPDRSLYEEDALTLAWRCDASVTAYDLCITRPDGSTYERLAVEGLTLAVPSEELGLTGICTVAVSAHVATKDFAYMHVPATAISFAVTDELSAPAFAQIPGPVTAQAQPVFAWNPVEGATGYRVQVTNTLEADAQPLVDETVEDVLTYTLPMALQQGQEIELSLSAVRAQGPALREGKASTTTVRFDPTFVPPEITGVTLSADRIDAGSTITFALSAANARQIDLYVDGNPSGISVPVEDGSAVLGCSLKVAGTYSLTLVPDGNTAYAAGPYPVSVSPVLPTIRSVSAGLEVGIVGQEAIFTVGADHADYVTTYVNGKVVGSQRAVLDGIATVKLRFDYPGLYQVQFAPEDDVQRMSETLDYQVTLSTAPEIVRLAISPSPATVGEAVAMAVYAENASTIQLYINGTRSSRSAEVDPQTGIATLTVQFAKAGTFNISFAANDDARYESDAQVLVILPARMEASEILSPVAGVMVAPAKSLTVTWSIVEGAAGYRVGLAPEGQEPIWTNAAAGESYHSFPWDPAWVDGTALTAHIIACSPEGDAYDSEAVTSSILVRSQQAVGAVPPTVTSLSVSPATIGVNESLIIMANVQGATKARLLIDGQVLGETDAVLGIIRYTLSLPNAGTYSIQIEPYGDGVWGSISAPQMLTVTE